MTSEVFDTVLRRLNRKLFFKNRKVILFLGNAAYHPESMDDKFTNIKIVFFPKSTLSRTQSLDAGIIWNFNVNYRKSLTNYVLSRITDNVSIADVLKGLKILIAILWVQRGMTSRTQQ